MPKLVKMALLTLGLLFGFDVAGVALAFFCDTFLSSRHTSTALYYVIWFVAGVFCGLLIYMCNVDVPPFGKVVDPATQARNRKDGLLVILITTIILSLASVFFYRIFWRLNMAPSVFVPDNEALSLTFYVTILISVIFFRNVMTSDPKPAPKRAPKRR